ncbi:MAG: ABC transporter permease [Bryobacteraceae bacterium]
MPRWTRKFILRLRSLFRRRSVERELEAELQFHLERETQANLARGLDRDEAHYAARRAMGGVAQIREECRDVRGVNYFEDLGKDLRFALRMLAKHPGFTTTAVLSLALGIGANTAIFSVVDSVLLRPLAYREPERLFSVREIVPAFTALYPTLPANPRHMEEWRKQWTSMEQVAAIHTTSLGLTGAGEPAQVTAGLVSWNFFAVLGVPPQFGRGFVPGEDRPGHAGVVLLSDAAWRGRFHADPSITGRKIVLDGEPCVVAGVLPAWFRAPCVGFLRAAAPADEPELYKPLGLDLNEYSWYGDFNYGAVARLKRGVTQARALAELNVVQARITRLASGKQNFGATLEPLQEQIVGGARRGLLILFSAVAAVLLIVCVNVANLLLASAARRNRELSIRAALGATRRRLVRQALTESLLLAFLGGALGLLLANWGVHLLVGYAPVDLPRLDEIRLNATVLLFALLVSTIAGVAAGILPAMFLAPAGPGESLKAASRSATDDRHGIRLRGALIGAEVALSVVLLVAAGLLLGSLVSLLHVERGFDVNRILTMDVTLPEAKYRSGPRIDSFYRGALARIAALPGVTSAGIVSTLPLRGEAWIDGVRGDGESRASREIALANYRFVSPGYFRTMGIALRQGRTFEDRDRGRSAAVISARVAKRLWPGENPVGKRIHRDRNVYEVTGVADDIRGISLRDNPPLMVYLPYWERPRLKSSLVIRAALPPAAIATAVRREIWTVDSGVPVANVHTMQEVLDGSVAAQRFQTALIALFAIAALLLASIGIYGVVSEMVGRRTNEIGIRMALGATAFQIRWMVLRQGLAPVAAGLAMGLAGSLALGRAIHALLFGVKTTDPGIIGAVLLLLTLVAAAACYIPARRATRIEPIAALRYD